MSQFMEPCYFAYFTFLFFHSLLIVRYINKLVPLEKYAYIRAFNTLLWRLFSSQEVSVLEVDASLTQGKMAERDPSLTSNQRSPHVL